MTASQGDVKTEDTKAESGDVKFFARCGSLPYFSVDELLEMFALNRERRERNAHLLPGPINRQGIEMKHHCRRAIGLRVPADRVRECGKDTISRVRNARHAAVLPVCATGTPMPATSTVRNDGLETGGRSIDIAARQTRESTGAVLAPVGLQTRAAVL